MTSALVSALPQTLLTLEKMVSGLSDVELKQEANGLNGDDVIKGGERESARGEVDDRSLDLASARFTAALLNQEKVLFLQVDNIPFEFKKPLRNVQLIALNAKVG